MEGITASAEAVAIVRVGVSFFSREGTLLGCMGRRSVFPTEGLMAALDFEVDAGLAIERDAIFGRIFGRPRSKFN
jgi:hypothetical protein